MEDESLKTLHKIPPNIFFSTKYNNNDHSFNENTVQQYDSETWEALSKNFRDVQSVLDQNRILIQQVNDNHQSKIHDNLVKNVALIREINDNIWRVISIYSHFSVDFVNIVNQQRANKVKHPSVDFVNIVNQQPTNNVTT